MISLLFLLVSQDVDVLPDAKQPALTSTQAEELPTASTVTLPQLLEAADKLNVDRRISLEAQDRAEAELRQAWTSLLPGLSAQANWTHNQYDAVIPPMTFGPNQLDPITIVAQDQLDAVGRVDLPLIDTNRWFRSLAAASAAEGAAQRTELTADQVQRAVTSGWYTYAASIALRVSAEKSVAVSEAQLKLQDIRMRSGAATELELLRARAEVERNKQAVADSIRLIAIARRNLRTITGLDPGSSARLPPVDLRPPPPLEELEKNVDQLPAVRAAVEDVNVSRKIAIASDLAIIPSVGGFFAERATNGAGFSGKTVSFTTGLSLLWRLDVPLFMAMQVQASNVDIAELQLEKTTLFSRDQINLDWQTLQSALIKVRAAQAQVEAAQRARVVATKRYEVGASTQIEVIAADRDLFTAEVQQIQAQSELASARVSLQISAGLPIEVQ